MLGVGGTNGYNVDMKSATSPKRILLVNRDFQLRYAGAGLLAGLVSTIITAFLIIYPLFAFKIVTIGIFLPWPIILAISGAIVINCFLQISFGIALTHRIAGPLFNLLRYLRMIGRGHWNVKMRQRKNDELAIVVRHLNEMSEELTKAVGQDIEDINNIQNLINETNLSADNVQSIKNHLDEISKRLAKRITAYEGIV